MCPAASDAPVRLGLRANLPQFALLVVINAFVGGVVGLQRTVVPLLGERVFHLSSAAFVTSFIASFGLVKALANLASGDLADRFGRRRVLILGWLVGVPVPFILMWAPNWSWIVLGNALLGVNQGLAWSMTVVMKVDLVGPRRRGLALGLNEFAGYAAVGVTAWASGLIAARWGLRPQPFYLGVAYVVIGLALSVLLARDTRAHAAHEARAHPGDRDGDGHGSVTAPSFGRVFALTSFRSRDLFAASQAGLVNNLNDGLAWGLLPLLFAARGLGVERIGVAAGVYPLVWGVGQLATGALSDRVGRKPLIVAGMCVQGGALAVIASGAPTAWTSALLGSALLGVGTAMVYPTLLATVGDAAHPLWRARALSVYRFWRDLGYAVGALGAGALADAVGIGGAVYGVAALTVLSGVVVWAAMGETLRGR